MSDIDEIMNMQVSEEEVMEYLGPMNEELRAAQRQAAAASSGESMSIPQGPDREQLKQKYESLQTDEARAGFLEAMKLFGG